MFLDEMNYEGLLSKIYKDIMYTDLSFLAWGMFPHEILTISPPSVIEFQWK